jgi:hypothetical protein
MPLMGWSSTDMAKRYQHVTDVVRTDVATTIRQPDLGRPFRRVEDAACLGRLAVAWRGRGPHRR